LARPGCIGWQSAAMAVAASGAASDAGRASVCQIGPRLLAGRKPQGGLAAPLPSLPGVGGSNAMFRDTRADL